MEHFFKNIRIENFKSIKHLELQDCNRINLFIGPPNVGKSNILEALSISDMLNKPKVKDPLFWDFDNEVYNIKNYLRLENLSELFFESTTNTECIIDLKVFRIYIKFVKENNGIVVNVKDYLKEGDYQDRYLIDDEFYIHRNNNLYTVFDKRIIKTYRFNSFQEQINNSVGSLSTPFGENLFSVVESNNKIKKIINDLFLVFGYKLVFDKSSKSLKIFKESKGEIFILPYSSIADTLQRYIFHLVAIKSNINSILLFEEPEAQCYPPYIKELTQEIVDSTTNQFFIATHSDIVVNHFLENAFDETTIYMVDFKDGQTVVQPLTEQNKLDIVNDGIDIFFNRDYFLTSNN